MAYPKALRLSSHKQMRTTRSVRTVVAERRFIKIAAKTPENIRRFGLTSVGRLWLSICEQTGKAPSCEMLRQGGPTALIAYQSVGALGR
ncbi:hypothetical protein ACVWXO_004285 [Bradyrhizobium sp. LM2.7]